MKVSNALSFLFTISIVIASPSLNLRKRLISPNLSKECEKELENYLECYGDLYYYDKDEIDNCCLSYHLEKCQNLREKGIVSIPECRNEDPKSIEIENKYIKIENINSDFTCAKNENTNRYCPIIQWLYEAVRANITIREEKFFYEAVNETCYSRNCRDTFIDFVVNYNDYFKLAHDFYNTTEYQNYKKNKMKNNNKSKRTFFHIENFNNADGDIIMNETAKYLMDNCYNNNNNNNNNSVNIERNIENDIENDPDSNYAIPILPTKFIPIVFLIFVLSILF